MSNNIKIKHPVVLRRKSTPGCGQLQLFVKSKIDGETNL